jgi:hypothetical protein
MVYEKTGIWAIFSYFFDSKFSKMTLLRLILRGKSITRISKARFSDPESGPESGSEKPTFRFFIHPVKPLIGTGKKYETLFKNHLY